MACFPQLPLPPAEPTRTRPVLQASGDCVLIDHSSLTLGMLMTKQACGEAINVPRLVEFLECDLRAVTRRLVVGSHWLRRESNAYGDAGYGIAMPQRPGSARAALVDSVISSDVYRAVLQCRQEGSVPGVIVVVTGGGRTGLHPTTFAKVMDMALHFEWTVVHWMWEACLTSRYNQLLHRYPRRYYQRLLDPLRQVICRAMSPADLERHDLDDE